MSETAIRTGKTSGSVGLWFDDRGDTGDQPVVLISGQGADYSTWDEEFVDALVQQQYRVIRFDNRDCGLSDGTDLTYTIPDLGADVTALLDHLDLPAAHLIGHSMGGMAAQSVAIDAPERVESLTLVSTTPDPAIAPADPGFVEFVLSQVVDEERLDGLVEAAVESARRQVGSRWPFDEADVRSRASAMFTRAFRPEGGMRQLGAIFASPPRTRDLRAFTGPALIVHGTEDPLLPVAHAHVLYAAIEHAQLCLVHGWGHIVPWGHWDVLLGPLIPHLAGSAETVGI